MLRNRTRPAETAPIAATRPRPVGIRLLVLFVVFVAWMALAGTVTTAASAHAVPGLLVGGVCAAAGLGLYSFLVRRLERRKAGEIARSGAGRSVGRGVLLGLGLFAGVVVVLAVTGVYRITGWGSFGGFLGTLGLMSSVAVAEELLFRGVVFRIVEELTGTWGAMVVSGLVFGGLHLVNPGATLWGALAIAVEAGAMLAAAYTVTRSLWLPIGLHLGWNLAEGGIFGTVVSGSAHGDGSLFTAAVHGPLALAGGTVGPEAGLPAVVLCSVLTVVLLRRAHRTGQIRTRRAARAVLSPTL